jgi:hypothetical protein
LLPVTHTFFGRSRNAITMGMGDLNMAAWRKARFSS